MTALIMHEFGIYTYNILVVCVVMLPGFFERYLTKFGPFLDQYKKSAIFGCSKNG